MIYKHYLKPNIFNFRFNKWSVEIGAGKTKRGRIAKQVNIEEDLVLCLSST